MIGLIGFSHAKTKHESSREVRSKANQKVRVDTSEVPVTIKKQLQDTKTDEAESIIVSFYISGIDFISSNVGYICLERLTNNNSNILYEYKLLKTMDGGRKWSSVGKNNMIDTTEFLDDKIGFGLQMINNNGSAREDASLVKTIDCGEHWNSVDSMQGKTLRNIDVVDKNVIFATDGPSGGNLYSTTDGGESWISIALPFDHNFYGIGGISWLSSQRGYVLDFSQPAAGMQLKTLYYTKDGGRSWSIKSSYKNKGEIPSGGYGNGIKIFSNGVGYLGVNRGLIQKSTDGGKTFKSISDYFDDNPVPYFINSNEGYAAFSNRTELFHTNDGGAHWNKILSANSELWNKN